MCWVSWDTLTNPKAEGGLGLRDIQLFNQVLLAKLAWRILTVPNCLLTKILLGKYCHNKSILEVSVPTVCSHGWRSILHGLELLKPHLGKAIGNGMSTKVWQDSWISLEKNVKPIGPVAGVTDSNHKTKHQRSIRYFCLATFAIRSVLHQVRVLYSFSTQTSTNTTTGEPRILLGKRHMVWVFLP